MRYIIIFIFRKYLNCETLEMFKYIHGTTFFNVIELKKIFRNRREKIYRNMWYIIFIFRKYFH
jgi:hypothetical protein